MTFYFEAAFSDEEMNTGANQEKEIKKQVRIA
jgi:hypothetical protein